MSTLQDAGRPGYRSIGIGSGGGMDFFAMKVAGYLCGNTNDGAVMEINFPAPEIFFEQDAIIGLAGADFSAAIDDEAIPSWRAIYIKRDSLLKFRRPVRGSKAYVAVQGGWNAERWLGSCSTHLKLGIGGHHGRSLQKDDRIGFEACPISFDKSKILPWQISEQELARIYKPSNINRCTRGPEYGLLNAAAAKNFTEQPFEITLQSDRMGYRLSGPSLSGLEPIELISSPVDAGTIQLLPNGQCIVLKADHQTAGGYPRIASVIRADIPKLAQAVPGNSIQFRLVGLAEAESELLAIEQVLQEIKTACYLNLKNYAARSGY